MYTVRKASKETETAKKERTPEEGKCRREQGRESMGVENGEVKRGEKKRADVDVEEEADVKERE